MEPEKLKILLQVMNQYPIELMETTIVNEEFVPRGWVISFVEEDKCIFIVTKQIQQVLEKIQQDDVKNKMELAFCVRCIINCCLRLYGVFGKDLLVDMTEKIFMKAELYEWPNLSEYIESLLKIYEDEQLLFRKGNDIVSFKIESEEQFDRLMDSRFGKDHYLPNEEDVVPYFLGNWVMKSAEYDKVYSCLNHEIKDFEQTEDILKAINEGIVIDDWEIPQIMNNLYDWDVAFESPRSSERMVKALCEWIYSVHRWSEYGYSKKARRLPNDQEKYIMHMNSNMKKETVHKKIYPNDPCTCGSGKKYKQCCGKKL